VGYHEKANGSFIKLDIIFICRNNFIIILHFLSTEFRGSLNDLSHGGRFFADAGSPFNPAPLARPRFGGRSSLLAILPCPRNFGNINQQKTGVERLGFGRRGSAFRPGGGQFANFREMPITYGIF
jgi:hypothetical protein